MAKPSRVARSRRRVAAAGAVRRSATPAKPERRHIGKLTAASVVVAGAVVWTTSSSDPFAPLQAVSEVAPSETSRAAVMAPAFFFDDAADALQRNHTTQNPGSLHSAAGESLADNPAANSISDIDWADSQLNGANEAASQPELLAMLTDESSSSHTRSIGLNSMTADSMIIDDIGSETPPARQSIQLTVASGDTLSGILNQNGLKIDRMRQLLTNDVVKEHLSNIDVGQVLELTRDAEGQFESLTTRVGGDTRVNIQRTMDGFDVDAIELPIERKRVVASGSIDQSLYLAAEQADLKQSTIMELANIFQWELDFARDIRNGDRFSLVYDRLYREGEYIGDGDILAAEFMRGGKTYQAIRFTKDNGETGYYSPDGQSKRRTFMRHPVDVVRITSKFDPKRLHPVLHQIRAHRGVDYGSPHGSPIYATADGKVIFSGSKNAYGKTVVLKHGEKFSTLYAHMSRISSKSAVGERVRQGDVIGYVGNTGRVTGTHLHYEFRVNGMQIDPLKVELPAAEPLPEKYHARLRSISEQMSVQMASARIDEPVEQIASALDSREIVPD